MSWHESQFHTLSSPFQSSKLFCYQKSKYERSTEWHLQPHIVIERREDLLKSLINDIQYQLNKYPKWETRNFKMCILSRPAYGH